MICLIIERTYVYHDLDILSRYLRRVKPLPTAMANNIGAEKIKIGNSVLVLKECNSRDQIYEGTIENSPSGSY